MSKTLTVTIKLHFSASDESCVIETQDVPMTLILEKLNTITHGMAKEILMGLGQNDKLPDAKIEKYFDTQIKVDRIKLKNMLR